LGKNIKFLKIASVILAVIINSAMLLNMILLVNQTDRSVDLTLNNNLGILRFGLAELAENARLIQFEED
jgi:hypothetical protein